MAKIQNVELQLGNIASMDKLIAGIERRFAEFRAASGDDLVGKCALMDDLTRLQVASDSIGEFVFAVRKIIAQAGA